jgi:alkanesulfonate monooxygenase SsuD/methylene tetrahydromethanopterin reductase-like flavin-dependent oxidoreductase (luciferase family)
VNVRYPDLADHEEDGPALTGDADSIAAGLAAHAADGADHVIAALDPSTPESLARFVEAVGRYRATEPVGSPS